MVRKNSRSIAAKKENYDREEKKLLNQKTKWKNMIIRSIGEHKQSEWARPTRTTMTTRCFFLDQVTQNQNQILFFCCFQHFEQHGLFDRSISPVSWDLTLLFYACLFLFLVWISRYAFVLWATMNDDLK